MTYRTSIASIFMLSLIAVANATPTDLADQRLREISAEVRCLVCQNQTLLDSSAPLALDLRKQIRELIASDHSNQQILTYLTKRYGDFVLYDPPFKRTTWLLWLGPFLFILATVAALLIRLRQQSNQNNGGLPPVTNRESSNV